MYWGKTIGGNEFQSERSSPMIASNEFVPASLRKALKEMWDTLTCKGMMCIYFWALVIVTVSAGIAQENLNVLFGYVAGIVLMILVIFLVCGVQPFFTFLKSWLLVGKERSDAFDEAYERGRYKRSHAYNAKLSRSDILFFAFFLGMIPFLFSFIITPANPNGEGTSVALKIK